MFKYQTILMATAQVVMAKKQEVCRALALSGGANFGSWEVGVMWGLTHFGDYQDFTWDVVTGVSAGAINTAAAAVFAPEDTVEMTQFLSDCWANLTTHNIWTLWPEGGIIDWITNEPGLLDSAPAVDYINSLVAPFKKFAKRFTVAAVDCNTGNYMRFNQDNIEFEELAQAAFASGSIPAVFPPQHFKDAVLMDGGTVWNINVESAVNQCLEIVEDESQIILDLIVCGYTSNSGGNVSTNALDNWMTAYDTRNYYTNTNSVQFALEAHPDVQTRYYFQLRDTGCHVPSSLDFNNSTTWCLQEAGRQNAKDILDIGQDKIHASLADWYDSRQEIQEEHPDFLTYLRQSVGF